MKLEKKFDFIAPIYEKIHPGAKKSFYSFIEKAPFRESDIVLDLGGGVGRIAKFFINRVKKIVVADYSKGMIEQCRTRLDLYCTLSQAEKLPFKDAHFDKIIIVESFHHFQNQEKVIREAKRVLKPTGKIILEEINPGKFPGWIIVILEKITGFKSNFLPPKELNSLWQKYGFKTAIENQDKSTYYLIAEKPKILTHQS